MSDTLYERLTSLARGNFARYHVPGHKGKPSGTSMDGTYLIDFTELPTTGNLYSPDHDIIKEAEMLCALYYNAAFCYFLTCGATQGVRAMLGAFCDGGGSVLLDRNSHKSAIEASILLGLSPSYISPKYDDRLLVTKGFDLEALDRQLGENPDTKAFFVTSPTYYGYCHDISAIKAVCQRHGVHLLVDSAHGGHLKACGHPDPISQGADAVVFSAHKTLYALTQGAYLLFNNSQYADKIRGMTEIFGTSSPSYPIMASLDLSRDRLDRLSSDYVARLISAVRQARTHISSLGFLCEDLGDPLRLCVRISNICTNPQFFSEALRKCGVEYELFDGHNIVFVITFADDCESLTSLKSAFGFALQKCSLDLSEGGERSLPKLPPLPPVAITPREAFFSPKENCILSQAVGRISGENIFLYPPGVPIVIVGEEITEKALEYLNNMSYNIGKEIKVVSDLSNQ